MLMITAISTIVLGLALNKRDSIVVIYSAITLIASLVLILT